jgi:hypothetical protein
MDILLHHSLPQLERKISTQLHDPASLLPVDRAHRNPFDSSLDWPQTLWSREKLLTPPANRTQAIQPVVSCYTE